MRNGRMQSSVTERTLTVQRIGAELRSLIGRCEDSAAAAAEGMDDSEQLPDVWQLAYKAALALAKAAAVDELLGNAATSAWAYHKVRHPVHSCPRREWYLLLDAWLQASLLFSHLFKWGAQGGHFTNIAPSACYVRRSPPPAENSVCCAVFSLTYEICCLPAGGLAAVLHVRGRAPDGAVASGAAAAGRAPMAEKVHRGRLCTLLCRLRGRPRSFPAAGPAAAPQRCEGGGCTHAALTLLTACLAACGAGRLGLAACSAAAARGEARGVSLRPAGCAIPSLTPTPQTREGSRPGRCALVGSAIKAAPVLYMRSRLASVALRAGQYAPKRSPEPTFAPCQRLLGFQRA